MPGRLLAVGGQWQAAAACWAPRRRCASRPMPLQARPPSAPARWAAPGQAAQPCGAPGRRCA
eukprot:10164820-Alexandrium_andersonii.AAC.1